MEVIRGARTYGARGRLRECARSFLQERAHSGQRCSCFFVAQIVVTSEGPAAVELHDLQSHESLDRLALFHAQGSTVSDRWDCSSRR
jgi:hypothetical protein